MHRVSLKIPNAPIFIPPTIAKNPSTQKSIYRASSPRLFKNPVNPKSPNHESAYKRITSNKSLKTLSLPSFLNASLTLKSSDKLKLKSEFRFSLTSDCQTDASSTKNLKNHNFSLQPTPKLLTQPELLQLIFEHPMQLETIFLVIKKIQLSYIELKSLKPGSMVSQNVLDSCLLCIKDKNRKFFKSSESHDRVLIFTTRFSQNILGGSEPMLHCKRNPLKYE